MIEVGTCYSDQNHLWIIISNPCINNYIISVNLTTWREENKRQDEACIFIPENKCHPFIVQKSFIFYNKAKYIKQEFLEQDFNTQVLFKKKELFNPNCLDEIIKGLSKSKHLEPNFKKYVKENRITLFPNHTINLK